MGIYIKYLIFAMFFYFLYKFVVRIVLPIVVVTRKIKEQQRNFMEQQQNYMDQQEYQETENEDIKYKKPKEAKEKTLPEEGDLGEYIDFEELDE